MLGRISLVVLEELARVLEHIRHVVLDGAVNVADKMVGPTGVVSSCLGVDFILLES